MKSNTAKMSPELFMDTVKELWAQGLTQQQIADELSRSLSAVRGRLIYYGFRFARGGRIVSINEK